MEDEENDFIVDEDLMEDYKKNRDIYYEDNNDDDNEYKESLIYWYLVFCIINILDIL